MSGPSPPIDISTPTRFSSASPRNHASTLTSALQQAGETDMDSAMEDVRTERDELKPTTKRQDSQSQVLGSSHGGSRPISVAGKPRRESGAGSFMGGMSWGGISVGSMLQDDITMGGTSPYNMHSPSYHSSSYLPKMEANFWSNLKCCDTTFGDLHELLQHFEEVHSQAPSTFPYRTSVPGNERLPRRKSSTVAGAHAFGQNPSDQLRSINQVRGFQPMPDSKMNGVQPMRPPHHFQNGNHKPSLSSVHDMDTIGEMEMDDEQSQPMTTGVQSFRPHEAFPQTANPSMPSMNPTLANTAPNTHGFQSSSSTTPETNQQGFVRQNNPTVSSVNTPAFNRQSYHQQQSNSNSPPSDQPHPSTDLDSTLPGQFPATNPLNFDSQNLHRLNADFGNLEFTSANGMGELCINEPAKALFSENGGINSQQFPQFSFANGTQTTDDEAAKNLQARQIAAGIAGAGKLPGEEDRPFKCPVIGCEKAYKNANGLRYHEKHGHSTQKLKENSDGTYSIVDPETSIPYPGTVGMEKEKPYRCEVCGKRYKNLNGLKYHRNHSPPCNPDFNLNDIALTGLQNGMGESIY